jgi:DNA-binding transcriptional MocR family regulator
MKWSKRALQVNVAPGYRVGWMAPGRHLRECQSIKFRTSAPGVQLQQEVIAEFLADGGYDHHMRRLRASLKAQAQAMADAITRYFPPGCRLSRPRGGLALWIELPPQVDSRKVFEQACRELIGVAPGSTFSCSARFDHFIRLHYGDPWTPLLETRLKRLGQIITQQL